MLADLGERLPGQVVDEYVGGRILEADARTDGCQYGSVPKSNIRSKWYSLIA